MQRRDDLRLQLARADALAGLALLAVVAGLLTGASIVAFRMLTESSLVWLGLMPDGEAFETLPWQWRLGLPVAGGLLIGLLLQATAVSARAVGPVHVMAQLARHEVRLPWRNAATQFIGGAISIICGHSVGREGPVIHVGAAGASMLGQWLRLPNNSIRTLVACGVAGAIAASFNTPVAGVVFAMEAVMLEYTLLGFAPVILSAFVATSVSRLVYGPAPAFAMPQFQLVTMLELPWVVLLGVVVGCMAAAYVAGVRRLDELTRRYPLVARTTAAGVFTGVCALFAPQIMGLGYDTVQSSLVGEFSVAALLLIAATKLVATIVCGGLGLPGGLIGPMIVMGATLGGAFGVAGDLLSAGAGASAGFYAALGMVAMMGASLQAPLAALLAILELTANVHTLMPGMVVVIIALLMVRVVFRQDPMFVAILRSRGMEYRFDPIGQALERIGVASLMSRSFAFVNLDQASEADVDASVRALADSSRWLLLTRAGLVVSAWATDELRAGSDRAHVSGGDADGRTLGASDVQAPAEVVRPVLAAVAVVDLHATLREAVAVLDRGGAEIAIVSLSGGAERESIRGVITRADIYSGAFHRY